MCSRGLFGVGGGVVVVVGGGWHETPCEACTRERLLAVMQWCYFKKGQTATATWLDLSADISNSWPPFYPPFHLFFTSHRLLLLPSKELSGSAFFGLADRSGVEGWGAVCPLRRGLRAPCRDVWGLRAVFKVLITFMVTCSQEVHKCQHSFAMGI